MEHHDFLRELVQSPALSFCATITHLCRAIRKLAAVITDGEMHRRLYRGPPLYGPRPSEY